MATLTVEDFNKVIAEANGEMVEIVMPNASTYVCVERQIRIDANGVDLGHNTFVLYKDMYRVAVAI